MPIPMDKNPEVYIKYSEGGQIVGDIVPLTIACRHKFIKSGEEKGLQKPTEVVKMEFNGVNNDKDYKISVIKRKVSELKPEHIIQVDAILSGEGTSLREFYNAYFPFALQCARKVFAIRGMRNSGLVTLPTKEPYDIATEAILSIFKKGESIKDVTDWTRFIYQTVANCAARYYRDTERDFNAINAYSNDIFSSPSVKDGSSTILSKVESILSSLTPNQRKVFLMSKVDLIPHRVIAERMGVTAGTIKKHVYDAMCIIRNELKRQGITKLVYE